MLVLNLCKVLLHEWQGWRGQPQDHREVNVWTPQLLGVLPRLLPTIQVHLLRGGDVKLTTLPLLNEVDDGQLEQVLEDSDAERKECRSEREVRNIYERSPGGY